MGYLPQKDADLLAWSNNMKLLISADAEAFGLSVAQATQYSTAQADFQAKFSLAYNPPTRTRVTVEQKELSKRSLIELTQEFVRIIQATPTVTDDQRRALAITVRKHPEPSPIPTEMPEMDILSVTGRTVKARLHSATHEGRAKPPLVKAAYLYTFVGETSPEDLSEWQFRGETTKTTFEITFPASVEPGTKVWLTACWVNARGQSGPARDPMSTHIQFGGVSLTNNANLKVAA